MIDQQLNKAVKPLSDLSDMTALATRFSSGAHFCKVCPAQAASLPVNGIADMGDYKPCWCLAGQAPIESTGKRREKA